jgi:hypothetical protein
VLAWIETCVEVVDPNSPDWKTSVIKSKEAHAAFVNWAKAKGSARIRSRPATASFSVSAPTGRQSVRSTAVMAISSPGFGSFRRKAKPAERIFFRCGAREEDVLASLRFC